MAQEGNNLYHSNSAEEGAMRQNLPYPGYPITTKKKRTAKIWSYQNVLEGDGREPHHCYPPYPSHGISSSAYPFATGSSNSKPIQPECIILNPGNENNADEPLFLGFKRDNNVAKADTLNGVTEPVKKRKESQCSLCANHNIYVLMKGHKFVCPKTNCPCPDCENTRKRQHFTKMQQKMSRRRLQERQNYAEEASSSKGSPIQTFQLSPPCAYPKPRLEELKPILKEDTSDLFGQINDLCNSFKKQKK